MLQPINLSLFKHAKFSPDKALKWYDRLAISIGVAKVVHLLHIGVISGCFRNQLKTNNILLDEHHIPKLSDYGMSIIAEEIEYLEVCVVCYSVQLLKHGLLCLILE